MLIVTADFVMNPVVDGSWWIEHADAVVVIIRFITNKKQSKHGIVNLFLIIKYYMDFM